MHVVDGHIELHDNGIEDLCHNWPVLKLKQAYLYVPAPLVFDGLVAVHLVALGLVERKSFAIVPPWLVEQPKLALLDAHETGLDE